MSPIEREIVLLLAESGDWGLDDLRAEVSRRLALRRWLTKGDIRTAISNLRGLVLASQESLGRPWRIRLATAARPDARNHLPRYEHAG